MARQALKIVKISKKKAFKIIALTPFQQTGTAMLGHLPFMDVPAKRPCTWEMIQN